jgi:hypothetical protein
LASSAAADLIDFAEAPARFTEQVPGRLVHVSDGYAFAGDIGRTWGAVEGIRLGDVEAAVKEVAELVRAAQVEKCSWWLSERSTPDDLVERLLALGLTRHDDDYLHAAMLLTSEPPRVDDIEAREVTTLEEYAELRRITREAFDNPEPEQPRDELEREWERRLDPAFAAWIDGRMASVGRVVMTRVGGYLIGGATAEWARGRGAYRAVVRARWDAVVARGTPALAVGAGPMSRPILERLGFERVLELRRVESVRSDT